MTGGNPYSDNSPFASPAAIDATAASRASSRRLLWILLGGGMLTVLLCCGGGVGVILLGFKVMTAEIKDQVRDNPKLREHVGEVHSVEFDTFGSMAAEGDETFRYKVRGSKSDGELTVRHRTNDDGDEVIEEAWLRLPSGERIKIIPDEP